jgi:hypothetical protein
MMSGASGASARDAGPFGLGRDASADAGSTASADAAPPADAGSEASCGSAAMGVAVDERELAGFPPYAVSGCTLVYVSRPNTPGASGELILRDLRTGVESSLAQADESPRRPTIAGSLIAWEATIDGHSAVRVRYSDKTTTLAGAFDHAGEPRATSDAVVFTAWTSADEQGDTDVWLYLPGSGELTAIVTGAGQQRFADVSPTHVAVSDFSEDPDGRYDGSGDLADIVLYDRVTRASTSRPLAGKQAFPMLGDNGLLAYLHWELSEVHPEPKLAGYHLKVGALAADGSADRELAKVVAQAPPYIRPAMSQGVVEWVASPDNTYRMFRARADSSAEPVAVKQSPLPLYAPAPASAFTLLATRAADAAARLEAVQR